MNVWFQIIAVFVGGAITALIGNLFIPRYLEKKRRPKLSIKLIDDWVISQDKQIIYYRLQVINEGKTVARECLATIRIKNATKENVLEESPVFKAILKPEDFGHRPILEEPQLLCWSMGGNPGVLNLNPKVPYRVDVLAFDYGQKVDPKNLPVVRSMVVPSEMGWNYPRVALRPGRYVVWVQVHGANCDPSNEVRFWVRRKNGAGDDHLEVSFTP